MSEYWDGRRDIAVLLGLVARVQAGNAGPVHERVMSALLQTAHASDRVHWPAEEDRAFKQGAGLIDPPGLGLTDPEALVDLEQFNKAGQDAYHIRNQIEIACRGLAIKKELPMAKPVGFTQMVMGAWKMREWLVKYAENKIGDFIKKHRDELEAQDPATWGSGGGTPPPSAVRLALASLAVELEKTRIRVFKPGKEDHSGALVKLAELARNRPSGEQALIDMRKALDGRVKVPIAALAIGALMVQHRTDDMHAKLVQARKAVEQLFKNPLQGLPAKLADKLTQDALPDWGLTVPLRPRLLTLSDAEKEELELRNKHREQVPELHGADVDWLVGGLFAVAVCREIYARGTPVTMQAIRDAGMNKNDKLCVLRLYEQLAGMKDAVIGPFMNDETEAAWLWVTRTRAS